MSRQSIPLKNPYLAAFLAWLVPGLGHFYQGRRGKGVLYFVCILGLFVAGLTMGGGKIVFWRWVSPFQNFEDFRLWYLAQFWVGLAAFPAVIQSTLARYGMSPILGGYLAEPALHVLNGMHRQYGRFIDIGTVYTAIAGLLNVLAIYDAFEGPALADEPDPSTSPEPAKPASLVLEPST
ncbi:MAG: hypothetical protein JWN86_2832 [Planctomycetota bacterium]|nr:hypothetical protein [Planctomycetota bacterium]